MSKIAIILTAMQQQCVDKIVSWYKRGSVQSFVLAGYAGTGKTFLIRHIIDKLGIKIDKVAFATFTGKASLVMTQKANGEYECQTLHSLLYNVKVDSNGKVTFIKKAKGEFAGFDLIVIDEASMPTPEIIRLLFATGRKLLFVGDHGQLPPIQKQGEPQSEIYTRLLQNPDFCLTEIHRQEEGSPIIYLSMLARTGKEIKCGTYANKALVFPKTQLKKFSKSILNADVLICARNDTRAILNADIRTMRGFTGSMPQIGEKLICTKNNRTNGVDGYALVNGMIGFVKKIKVYSDESDITFRPDFTNKTLRSTIYNKQFLDPKANLGREAWGYDTYEFGYAITCHKSQGSQWDKVFVYNEALRNCDHSKWLYTAITRASDALILAI